MNSKTAMRASACVLNRRRSSSSHSSVAKKLSPSRCRRRRRPSPSRDARPPHGSAAERDRGILRALVGVVDHVPRPPRHQRHVQRIEHELRGECGGHRPADDPPAEGIEHDGEIEKARPRRNVGDVGDPQPIRRSAMKLRSTRSGAWRPPSRTVVVTNLRRLTPARPACRINRATRLRPTRMPLGGQLGMNARRTVGAVRGRVCGTDLGRSASHRLRRAATAAASPTHNSRWRRHPAAGTSWRSDSVAWFSLTNRNPSLGSRSSPERTRPRLLRGSPAPA